MNKQPPPLTPLHDIPQSDQLQTLLAEHIRHIKNGKHLYFQGFERCPGHLSQMREMLMKMSIDLPVDDKSSNS